MSLLAGRTIAVVDTETTGFSPARGDALVEVAVVFVTDGVVPDSRDGARAWSTLVHPGRDIPPEATRVHGIDDAMLRQGPTLAPAEAARLLRERCGELPLAFHNAPFDLPFLVVLLRAAGQPPLTAPVVDTLGLARGVPNGAPSNALGVLAQHFGLPKATAHRALGDAMTTAHLLVHLARHWKGRASSFAEFAAASQERTRWRPVVPR
jgi:DNA polymerase III epsilon subunit-like protein